MKTRLLLFFLLAYSYVNAQITNFSTPIVYGVTSTTATISVNVSTTSSFASVYYQIAMGSSASVPDAPYLGNQSVNVNMGNSPVIYNLSNLVPNTIYYFRYKAFFNGYNSASSIVSFTTGPAAPAISAISSSAISYSSAMINYTINQNGASASTVIKYGISSTNLSSQVIGGTGITSTALNNLLPTTEYYYQIESTNAVGTNTSAIGSFITLSLADITVAEYNFDNTYNNINGNTPFNSTPATSFVNNRSGESQKALRINTSSSTVCMATIPTLPTANNSRTISLWYKNDSFTTGTPAIFVYGANANNQYFGNYINTTGNINLWSYTTDHNFGGSYSPNVWRHLVMTHDGTNVKLYINGTYIGQKTTTLNTGNAIGFRIGNTVGAVEYDDLKIYNVALSQTEISNLYNYNSIFSLPAISSVNATGISTSSATITYSLNANNNATTSVVKYGLTSNNLSSQVVGFSVTGSSLTPGTAQITGLTANTVYYYKVEATNSVGTNTTSSGTFATITNPNSSIAEYNFNNTYNNVNGNTPFTSNTGTSFTTDRNGNANSALNLVSIGTSATIPNLPYGSSPRTISVWVKNYSYNSFVASACPFSYGTTANAYELAMYETQFKLNPYLYPLALNVNLVPLNITNALNTWNHYVVSYNGTTSKIYKDGALLSSLNSTLTTANNSDIFRLGLLNSFTSDYFDGAIDDLKIYNYALTDAEVTSLYASNTLSTTNFSKNNLQASVYPNPTNDILNIQMEKELKTATIYTVLGNQVLVSTNKQINVASLSSGNYLVRIEAVDGAVTTQKIIIK